MTRLQGRGTRSEKSPSRRGFSKTVASAIRDLLDREWEDDSTLIRLSYPFNPQGKNITTPLLCHDLHPILVLGR